jgi:phospholipase C
MGVKPVASVVGRALLLVLALSCIERDPRGAPPRPSEAVRAPLRSACTFRAGALPSETLGREIRIGSEVPFDHVLVLMQENRSFDHYYGQLARSGLAGVEGPPGDAFNLDREGMPVARFHETEYCNEDTAHSWTASHLQYGGGRNDGFVVASGSHGRIAMGYYDESDLPFYYGLAKVFGIGDRFFCSLLGPTLPNRMFQLAGTSFGLVRNTLPPADAPNIFEALEAKGLPWKVYGHSPPSAAMFATTAARHLDKFVRFDDFFRDAQAGRLPAFAFIEPDYLGGGAVRTDEHPPGNVQLGQSLVARVVHAVLTSPAWSRTVLFFTYDEHGGYYDHVPPPPACTPGGLVADNPDAVMPLSEFNRLGFRVPFFAISAYTKRGHVTHQQLDHTSILRFVEARFGLAALSDRTANATPPTDIFDFDRAPILAVPPLPEARIDEEQLMRCMERFPGGGGLF